MSYVDTLRHVAEYRRHEFERAAAVRRLVRHRRAAAVARVVGASAGS